MNEKKPLTEAENGGTGWFEDPLVKGKGERNSGAEPYDARVSRTVPLRRV